MKKIILVLMFSLGLVSAVNAESVCNSFSIEDKVDIGKYISYFATGNGKAEKSWDKLIVRYHTAEIKKSDKETLCVYMATIRQGYLDIQLTPQEIERFERFLVEKSIEKGGDYNRYEKDKDFYLKAVKFFKYYNKLDLLYNKKRIEVRKLGYYDYGTAYDNLAMVASRLENYENESLLAIKKFIYGKNMGDYFDYYDEHTTQTRSINGLKREDNQDAKNIAKWAESKLKESK